MPDIKSSRCGRLLGIAIVSISTFWASCAVAQIIPDGTLPNNSIVTPVGSTINITGGTQAGSNLFHSFEEFSVANGGVAIFKNATDIQNIISRVTGKSVSNINGLIKANGAANLFLINPNGILFGKDARLDIGGSFLASTASSLKFTDGFEFSTKAPQTTPLLSISVPLGLQFGGITGNIVNQSARTYNPDCYCYTGGLEVSSGKTLALIGGNVSLDGGGLQAPSGSIELGGLAEPGIVGLNVDSNNLRLSFPNGLARADVSLTNARVSVASNPYTSVTPAGSVAINARNLNVSQSLISAFGFNSKAGEIKISATRAISSSNSSFDAGSTGGVIKIEADSISLANSYIQTNDYNKGQAGSVDIKVANSLSLIDSTISSLTLSNNQISPGKISIEAKSVSIKGNFSWVSSNTMNVDASNTINVSGYYSGFLAYDKSSHLNINTGSLALTDGAVVGTGQQEFTSGDITINADSVTVSGTAYNDVPSHIFADTWDGTGGNITINAKSLLITNGAYLSTQAKGEGQSGNITVNADSVTVSGFSSSGTSSGLFAGTLFTFIKPERGSVQNTRPSEIQINADSLRVTDGAIIGAGTTTRNDGGSIFINVSDLEVINGGQILTTTFNSGNAGDITVNATERIIVSGSNPNFINSFDRQSNFGNSLLFYPVSSTSGLFANASENSIGRGGSLKMTTKQLQILNGAQVAVNSQGTGNAGNLEVEARSIRLNDRALLTADTTAGQGNINLRSKDLLLLRDSKITTNATVRHVIGGNINIDTDVLVAMENSDISANSANSRGGNVRINTQGVFRSPDSEITATGESPGLGGNVEINGLDVDRRLGLVELPTVLADTTALVDTSCTSSTQQTASSFTITGRGGIPLSPDKMLISDDVLVNWVALDFSKGSDRPASQLQSVERSTHPKDKPALDTPAQIVEAAGWVINARGEVILTANPSIPETHGSWQNLVTCNAF